MSSRPSGRYTGGIDYTSELSHSIHQSGGRVIPNTIGQSGEYRGRNGLCKFRSEVSHSIL